MGVSLRDRRKERGGGRRERARGARARQREPPGEKHRGEQWQFREAGGGSREALGEGLAARARRDEAAPRALAEARPCQVCATPCALRFEADSAEEESPLSRSFRQ